MPMTTLGDMASGLMLRTRSTQLKQTIERLTDELATGQVSDVNARLGGDYGYLTDIESNLKRYDAYAIASAEAGVFASTMQTSLERVQDLTGSLSASLTTIGTWSVADLEAHGSGQAEADLNSMMSALNTSVGGRAVFSGTATDQAPLPSADILLTELGSAIAGLTDVDDIRLAAANWFDDPAGFAATVYQGGSDDLGEIRIGEGESVGLSIRADDQVLRDAMRETALAALATDPNLGLDDQTQRDLIEASGQGLQSVEIELTGLRANLGFAEARIEESMARSASARTSLEYARASLLEADPFETATRLDEVQFQLESLYAVTVRTSGLNLVNFL